MFRFLFKQSRPKRFDFKPRFYDEQKERFEFRKAAALREMNPEKTGYSENAMRENMHNTWRSRSSISRSRSNRNTLLIAAVLFLLMYILLRF